jgi:hypothetical protein
MQPTPQNFLWITFRASRYLDIYPIGMKVKTPGAQRELGMQDGIRKKTGETLGSLGVSGLKLSCFLARAAGGMERIRRKLGKTKGSLGSFSCQARPVRSCNLSTAYPQEIIIREFRSLTRFCLGQGPRAFPRTTRVRGPRCFGQVPWFCTHETV